MTRPAGLYLHTRLLSAPVQAQTPAPVVRPVCLVVDSLASQREKTVGATKREEQGCVLVTELGKIRNELGAFHFCILHHFEARPLRKPFL